MSLLLFFNLFTLIGGQLLYSVVVVFCHTLTWISHGCTCVPTPWNPSPLLPPPVPLDCLSALALSALLHASDLAAAAAAAKSLQSCLTLCDPIDISPPGSPIPGILQARTLEWVAISSSNACKWKVKLKSLSHVRLLATPWTTAYQCPPSMGLFRQEYWSGMSLLSLASNLDWLSISHMVIYMFQCYSLKSSHTHLLPESKVCSLHLCLFCLCFLIHCLGWSQTSLVAETVKRLPTMRETQVQSLGWEDLLEKEMATHSSILAWEIPWTEEPGGL